MSNEITSELLIQYLDNELDAVERASVETALAADQDLQNLLERLKLAKLAFSQYARREAVAGILSDEKKESAPVVKINRMRSVLRIAAVLLVLLVIGGIVQYSLLDAQRLYSAQYKQYTLGTTRAAESASPLERAYRNHNFGDVIAIYEKNDSLSNTDHFLAGQAYLQTGNATRAIVAFENQININGVLPFKPYQDDAEYYLALSYLKLGEVSTALELFEKINQQPQHAYSKEVGTWFLTRLRWLSKKEKN
ncbi:MAG TPA: tetratricopeptide repeat protein [Chitinophagaceae bacterium]|nr:tetratricopeptide repeat protein [Chitinophagaceae bacterium]